MAIPTKYHTKQGVEPIKRGEGITFTIDVANQTSQTPTNLSMTIVSGHDVDGTVVSPVWHSGSPTAAGTVITLPEITPPAGVTKGEYTAIVEFDAGGYVNSPRYVMLEVF